MASTPLLPWKWTVAPESDTSAMCPSPKSILGTFVAINVVVSVFGLYVGHRRVVNQISCTLFGRQGSEAWRYTWTLSLAIQLAANALVAAVIKHTAGYGSNFA